MWILPTLTYWSSLGLLTYTYVGYPLGINALARLRTRRVRSGDLEPSVSVVMAAHNEAARVGTKLENLLGLDYPAHKLEVIVVSDGSDDGTDEVVRGYEERGVSLVGLARQQGKAAALNKGVARARGEVVVFCDVRQVIHHDALHALVAPFGDPQVGAVSGELVMVGDGGPGLYWRYEKMIRAAEARVDSLVGATGALYAIRRHLYRELPPDCLLDDVFTPMQIVLRGYRVLFEPGARCTDQEAPLSGEFARKARTLAGNFQLLRQLPRTLSPVHNRLFVQFVSHKLLRLACPVALGTLLASNLVLVATGAPGWPFYVGTLGGNLAMYGLALRAALFGGKPGKLARTSHTFVVLNAAAVEGLRRYLNGDFGWTTSRQVEDAMAPSHDQA